MIYRTGGGLELGSCWRKRGHDVTVATATPMLAKDLEHTAADVPLRRRFGRAGGEALVNTIVTSWSNGTAEFLDTITGETTSQEFDSLVVAGTGEPRTGLFESLSAAGIAYHGVGDCVAARKSIMAIYEGRKLGREL